MPRNKCLHRGVKTLEPDIQPNRSWTVCMVECESCGARKLYILDNTGNLTKIPGKRWSRSKSFQSALNSPLTHPKVRVD